MRRTLLCLVSATTLTLLAGCGSDSAPTAPAALEGEYALETVNGLRLPFLKTESAAERVEVVSGSLMLRSDRTYQGNIVEQWTTGANIQSFPETSAGTFSVASNRITFTEGATGAVYSGTINGNRISATLNDVTFGFVRK